MNFGTFKFLLLVILYILAFCACLFFISIGIHVKKFTDADFLGDFLIVFPYLILAVTIIISEFYFEVISTNLYDFLMRFY